MAKIAAVHFVLSASLIATPATADQKIKTKSNIKNDRVVAPPPGASGCATGDEAFAWTVDDQPPTVAARANGTSTGMAIDPAICAGAQGAISQINASATELARLRTAIESCDDAALRDLMSGNGLSTTLVAGAQFHAINTKGTGCNNGRVGWAGGAAVPRLVISVGFDTKKSRGYSLANCMFFNAK